MANFRIMKAAVLSVKQLMKVTTAHMFRGSKQLDIYTRTETARDENKSRAEINKLRWFTLSALSMTSKLSWMSWWPKGSPVAEATWFKGTWWADGEDNYHLGGRSGINFQVEQIWLIASREQVFDLVRCIPPGPSNEIRRPSTWPVDRLPVFFVALCRISVCDSRRVRTTGQEFRSHQ